MFQIGSHRRFVEADSEAELSLTTLRKPSYVLLGAGYDRSDASALLVEYDEGSNSTRHSTKFMETARFSTIVTLCCGVLTQTRLAKSARAM